MTRGDKSKYTAKQKRKARHIEEGYEDRGLSEKEAERRAWATVNKQDHGGKKGGRLQKGSTTVSLIVLALIVLAIGVVAVMTGKSRTKFEDASLASQIGTTTEATSTIPAASAATKTTAKSAAPNASTKPAIQSTVAPRPAANPAPIAPAGTSSPLCTANDLTGMAALQGSADAIVGTISIANSSNRACAFSRDLGLELLSGNTALGVPQTANYQSGILTDLLPGETADVDFVWGNWCRSPLSAPLSVRVSLASGAGYLKVPFIASDGRAQSDFPACQAMGTGSYIYIR